MTYRDLTQIALICPKKHEGNTDLAFKIEVIISLVQDTEIV